MSYIENLLTSISTALMNIGPALSLIMLIFGGIVYALAQAQPAEQRGKWIGWSMGLFIGGIVLAAIIGAATLIRDTSMNLLT